MVFFKKNLRLISWNNNKNKRHVSQNNSHMRFEKKQGKNTKNKLYCYQKGKCKKKKKEFQMGCFYLSKFRINVPFK